MRQSSPFTWIVAILVILGTSCMPQPSVVWRKSPVEKQIGSFPGPEHHAAMLTYVT